MSLKLKNRILLNNGISIIEQDAMVEKIIESGYVPDHLKVLPTEDSYLFKIYEKQDISHNSEDSILTPMIQTEFDEMELVEYLFSNRRDDTPEEDHKERIEMELNFFENNNNLHLLKSLGNLIKSFKENDVIWGVGRGSSCASYVLYLLEVHDINPIKYDIPFNEFSKEN